MRTLLTAYGLLALATLCWAGNFVVGRAMHAEIPPVAFNFWRWTVAAAVLAPFAAGAAWRHLHVIRAEWRALAVLALLGVTVFNAVAYTGLNFTAAVNAALIMASQPVIIMLLSFALYGERVAPRQAVGVALSFVGVAVVVLRGEWAALAELEVAIGDLWILGAAVLWCLYSVLLRERPVGLPALPFLFAITVIGLAMMAPLFALEAWARGPIRPTAETLASLGYVGVFASVVAYVAWNRGVADVGAARAGHTAHMIPVFTTILGVLVLGERLHAYHGWGAVLIAAGLALATVGTARARA